MKRDPLAYKVVHGSTSEPNEFFEVVSMYMEAGWVCQGGAFHFLGHLGQAMVRPMVEVTNLESEGRRFEVEP